MKKIIDNNLIGEKFIVEWNDKTIKLDKDSLLYSKKAQNKFRDLCTNFFAWLKDAQTEEGVGSAEAAKADENGEDSEEDQIKEKGNTKETDAQRRYRENVERQNKMQKEKLDEMKR